VLIIPKPSKKATEKVYDATVVRSDTNSGARSFESRSIRRKYVLSLVNFSACPSAITVTQSLSTATDIPIVDNLRTQPHIVMRANIIHTTA
jgi:hypothetical protein